MLEAFDRVFDYADFEKKLRHYFSDTAPIYARVEMRVNEVQVSAGGTLTVQVGIDGGVSVKENIKKIIHCCEQSLYPKMLDLFEQSLELTEYQKKKLLFQGYTLEQIYEKQMRKVWKRFIITRFNVFKNSLDYKEEAAGKLFRAHFNRPLVMVRDSILRLSEGGKDGMRELYQFVKNNAKIEELEADNVQVPADIG